ncbi:MAG: histidine phosphatase family protein [Pseudomonadota bacterium]
MADISDRESFSRLAARLPSGAQAFSSGLIRTRQTAQAVVDAGWARGEFSDDARLAEQHYGEWHGQTAKDLKTALKTVGRHPFWFANAEAKPPGGESFLDVIERAEDVLADVASQHLKTRGEERQENEPKSDFVFFTHGGFIRAVLSLALTIPPDRALNIMVENLSLTRLDRLEDGEGVHWRLVFQNWSSKR